MEIQTNIPPAGNAQGAPSSGQERSAPSAVQTPAAVPPTGIVVDIQARQDPLSVAYTRVLQSLSESFGLTENGAESNPPSGPESVATRISSVAANVIATSQSTDGNSSDVAAVSDAIRQVVDQAFDEARSTAADPGNVPLQQARDATKHQLDTLEGLLGLRDNQA